MTNQTRDLVLSRLKSMPDSSAKLARPQLPAMPASSMDREQLIETFKGLLEAQTGVFKRAKGKSGVLAVLAEVFQEEGISCAVASEDAVLSDLGLKEWGEENGLTIRSTSDSPDPEVFKKVVFTEVDAGITGADYGIAESGTLCILAGRQMPRLTSLAPPIHIAVLPAERLLGVYEDMVAAVFKKPPPSQVILITGPSMTADIQATSFKGMHGPRRLIVIFREGGEEEVMGKDS
jgi:L-lactate dehydrogenase complex protein LldG